MPILAMAMQKGGVGKTTTTLAVGVELARMGRRVLLVDADPQSNLTMIAGYDPATISLSIADVLAEGPAHIHQAIIQTTYGVHLLPATLSLAGAEPILSGRIGRELLLRAALREVREQYDYILIDSPPNLGLFTLNVLAAADAVIVPLQAHVLAFKALPQLEQTIQLVRQLNPVIQIGGIIVTMVDKRTMVNQEVEDAARQQYGSLVFETVVPFTVRLVEAPAAAQPISVYAPDSTGAKAYLAIAQEVARRYG
ncbi:ParA family protein [Oscillochloris sp. ZM17-4]|uniref:ParA family protein n=1 Tax=Oscillochloris sp. ZM17-4 TaxID=2866714 RepID=UPI001C7354EF|nr:ParA family protein [Oscillochloris sp. ZM17-4]MBX0329884.1 ParA family protein [Oscillochloris sp. ZM17-4]